MCPGLGFGGLFCLVIVFPLASYQGTLPLDATTVPYF